MKKIILVGSLLLAAGMAQAQSSGPDLGGVGQFIANLALSARGGTAVDFKKNIDGVLYVPFPSFHSSDKSVEYGTLGLGVDLGAGVSGTKLHGSPLVLPMGNVVGLTDWIMGSSWATQHLTFTNIGSNVAVGIGVLPFPVVGSRGKLIIGNQLKAVVTIGLGSKPTVGARL